MVCDPNEHNFVKQTSYSIELETESAVVKEGTEEKRCTECGKTPEELGDFVSSNPGESDESEADDTIDAEANQNVQQDDDAIIMGSDNSENQSAQRQAASVTHGDEVDEESSLHEGDQTDDAYILDSGGSEVMDEDTSETTSDDALVPSGPTLACSNCGFECPESETPHYPGDSCPDCQRAYLQKE